MKPQEIEKWKGIRKKGVARFIVITGILSYGIPMFVALNFITPSSEPLTLLNYFVLFLITTVAGGSLFGYFMWLVQEKRYKKASGA